MELSENRNRGGYGALLGGMKRGDPVGRPVPTSGPGKVEDTKTAQSSSYSNATHYGSDGLEPAREMFTQAAEEGSINSMWLALESLSQKEARFKKSVKEELLKKALSRSASSNKNAVDSVLRDSVEAVGDEKKALQEASSFLTKRNQNGYNALLLGAKNAHVPVVELVLLLCRRYIKLVLKLAYEGGRAEARSTVLQMLGLSGGRKGKVTLYHTPLTLACAYSGTEIDAQSRAAKCVHLVLAFVESREVKACMDVKKVATYPDVHSDDNNRLARETAYLHSLWKFLVDFPASLEAFRRVPMKNEHGAEELVWCEPAYDYVKSIADEYETLDYFALCTDPRSHIYGRNANHKLQTAMMLATLTSNVDALDMILKRGPKNDAAYLDARDINGCTALMLVGSSLRSALEITKALYAAHDMRHVGGTRDIRVPNGLLSDDAQKCTLSHLVGRFDAFGYVLQHVLTILRREGDFEYLMPFALVHAKQHNNSFDVEDINGYTPLMYACQAGALKTVDLLLTQGSNLCNPAYASRSGQTALMVAAQCCDPQIMARLLGDYRVTEAFLTRTDVYGMSALHIAASREFDGRRGVAAGDMGGNLESLEEDFRSRQHATVIHLVEKLELYKKRGMPLHGAVNAFLHLAIVAQQNFDTTLLSRLGIHPLQPVPYTHDFVRGLDILDAPGWGGYAGRAAALMEQPFGASQQNDDGVYKTVCGKLRQVALHQLVDLASVERTSRASKLSRLFGESVIYHESVERSKVELTSQERTVLLDVLRMWPETPKLESITAKRFDEVVADQQDGAVDWLALSRGTVLLHEVVCRRGIGRDLFDSRHPRSLLGRSNMGLLEWIPAVSLIMGTPQVIENAFNLLPKFELASGLLDSLLYKGHKGRIYQAETKSVSEFREWRGTAIQLIPEAFSMCDFHGERPRVQGPLTRVLKGGGDRHDETRAMHQLRDDVKACLAHVLAGQDPDLNTHKSMRAISAILWTVTTRRKVVRQMAIYLFLVFCFTLMCFLHKGVFDATFGTYEATTLAGFMGVASAMLASVYSIDEMRSLLALMTSSRGGGRRENSSFCVVVTSSIIDYFSSPWNVLDIMTIICVLFCCSVCAMTFVNSTGDSPRVISDEWDYAWGQVAAIGLVLVWVSILQFAMQFTSQSWGLFTNIVAAMIYNVRVFMIILFISIWAFSAAFHVVMRGAEGNETLFESAMSLYRDLLGDTVDYGTVSDVGGPAGVFLFVTYGFFIPIVMVNFLIALMATTYEQVTDAADKHMALKEADTLASHLYMMNNSDILKSTFGPALNHRVMSMVVRTKADQETEEDQALNQIEQLQQSVLEMQAMFQSEIRELKAQLTHRHG